MPQLGLQRGGKDHVSCEVKLFHRFGDLNCWLEKSKEWVDTVKLVSRHFSGTPSGFWTGCDYNHFLFMKSSDKDVLTFRISSRSK